MDKFPFSKLPLDIQCNILSKLTIYELKYISEAIPYDILYNTFKFKYSGICDFKIKGTIRNFKNRCFICKKLMLGIYNLLLCQNCSIDLKAKVHYPEMCQDCTKIKLKRGKTALKRCPLCNQFCTQLGITCYS